MDDPDAPITAGFLVFPGLTHLDLSGPLEVLGRVPGVRALTVWRDAAPVPAGGLTLVPDVSFADCPQLDVLCVPGGPGVDELLADGPVLDFLRRQATGARWICGVCTGSLLLGAAGLLRGRRATSHWLSRHMLAALGAEPVARRVVEDGNVLTAAGVTAGIDLALLLAERLAGRTAAEAIQLALEYDPRPPFAAGTPDTAPAGALATVRAQTHARQRKRGQAVAAAAAKLKK